MNKRIEELAIIARSQADQTFYALSHGIEGMPPYKDVFNEEFAKLIIQECIYACGKHKDIESFGIYPIRVALVTRACERNIEQHFREQDE